MSVYSYLRDWWLLSDDHLRSMCWRWFGITSGRPLLVDRKSFLVPSDDLGRPDAFRRESELRPGVQHFTIVVRTLVLLTLVLAVHLYLRLFVTDHTRRTPLRTQADGYRGPPSTEFTYIYYAALVAIEK